MGDLPTFLGEFAVSAASETFVLPAGLTPGRHTLVLTGLSIDGEESNCSIEFGAMMQLVARLVRNEKVRSSNLLSSTTLFSRVSARYRAMDALGDVAATGSYELRRHL